jgi:hypothetical protein
MYCVPIGRTCSAHLHPLILSAVREASSGCTLSSPSIIGDGNLHLHRFSHFLNDRT